MRVPLRSVPFARARLLLTTAAALSIAACDGIAWIGTTGFDQSPGGFYDGSFTSTATQPAPGRQAVGMVSEEFVAHFLLADQHYAGVVAVRGSTLSGTLLEYRGRQGVFVGFDGLSAVSLDGEVAERGGMSGTYAGPDAQGRFGLTYSSAYEEGSSLDRLSGIWSYNETASGGGVYTITLDIDDTGVLFATDSAGCVFSGQLSIIDGRYSAYRAAISVSTCGDVSGDYDGLAFSSSAGSALLYLGADNGLYALAARLERL